MFETGESSVPRNPYPSKGTIWDLWLIRILTSLYICFRIASLMEMEMAQFNDKFRRHGSDWIECTTGGFRRLSGFNDWIWLTQEKHMFVHKSIACGKDNSEAPNLGEEDSSGVWGIWALQIHRHEAYLYSRIPLKNWTCLATCCDLVILGQHGLKKPESTTLQISAVSIVSGEFSRFFHQF